MVRECIQSRMALDATKLDASADRGAGDVLTRHDLAEAPSTTDEGGSLTCEPDWAPDDLRNCAGMAFDVAHLWAGDRPASSIFSSSGLLSVPSNDIAVILTTASTGAAPPAPPVLLQLQVKRRIPGVTD